MSSRHISSAMKGAVCERSTSKRCADPYLQWKLRGQQGFGEFPALSCFNTFHPTVFLFFFNTICLCSFYGIYFSVKSPERQWKTTGSRSGVTHISSLQYVQWVPRASLGENESSLTLHLTCICPAGFPKQFSLRKGSISVASLQRGRVSFTAAARQLCMLAVPNGIKVTHNPTKTTIFPSQTHANPNVPWGQHIGMR